MATVVNVKKQITGASSNIDDRTEIVDVWTVLFDDLTGDPTLAASATGLPVLGTGHTNNPYAVLSAISATPKGGPLYEVQLKYRSPAGGGSVETNPLALPAEVRWSGVKVTEPIDYSLDGGNQPTIPIINAATIPFEGVSTEITDPVVSIQWNVADTSFSVAQMVAYQDAVSSDGYLSDPGQAKIELFDATFVRTTDLNYWTLQMQIRFRRGIPLQADGTGGPARAWWKRLLNQGKTYLDTATAELIEVADSTGALASEPRLLAADGSLLASGGTPIWLEFKMYPELPFSALLIPYP